MSPRRGSWPVLLALAAAFLLLFSWQRGRSTFLRIEAERDAAQAIAEQHGLPLAAVFALRDMVGVDAPEPRWRDAARAFAVDGALLVGDGDPALARRRFELMRARFSERAAARH